MNIREIINLLEAISPDDLFSEELAVLPKSVVDAAAEMLSAARSELAGDTAFIDGYHIETHTIGCRNQADDPEEKWWDRHYEIYDEYRQDGLSIVAGDPADGVFVTITPTVR